MNASRRCNMSSHPPSPQNHASASRRSQRLPGLLFACILLLSLAGMPRLAKADCGFSSGQVTTVTFNAGTITLTLDTQPGTVLWTSSTASPANPPVLRCNGSTHGGIVNTIAGPPIGSDNTLFPTGIPGISYRILHPDVGTKLREYPDYPTGSGTFSVTSNLQLVYTGPFLPPNNSTLSGELSQWKIDICNNPDIFLGYYFGCHGTVAPRPVEIFNINAIIHVLVPSCDIATGSINKTVALPETSSLPFSGPGATTGKTPFQLQLTDCPDNLGVFITLHTDNAQPGATGVIAPTSGAGHATGVGVQILQANGTTPVTFDTALDTGTTSNPGYTIDFYAQYYQTGATISAGKVKATATYLIQYQ